MIYQVTLLSSGWRLALHSSSDCEKVEGDRRFMGS